MGPLYCSQGHNNPAGSQFCNQCGEKLLRSALGGSVSGALLGDRYRILRILGQGGFGKTFLAEDTNRFNEACVLKEFAPQVEGEQALRKAEELFAREAGILYRLKHSQIPGFRELFRVNLGVKGRLFLVQDYVAGQTYRSLLEARRNSEVFFNEAEVTRLLLQLLPVLSYIHRFGVIHRDIAPDNLMQRSGDGLPVLIDFGGVKQIAAVVSARLAQQGTGEAASPGTRLGKPGYAPPEQMQQGKVYPHSDLYALAATVVVLLTGQEPQSLIDPHSLQWQWRQALAGVGLVLQTRLGAVLDRMLSPALRDRYQSAEEVLQVLEGSGLVATSGQTQSVAASTLMSSPSGQKTLAVASAAQRQQGAGIVSKKKGLAAATPDSSVHVTRNIAVSVSARNGGLTRMVGCIVVLFLLPVAGMGGWWAGKAWLNSMAAGSASVESKDTAVSSTETGLEPRGNYSREENARKTLLNERRQSAGIERAFFSQLVNEVFWGRYPSEQGRLLSDRSRDKRWRRRWDEVAEELLGQLAGLSSEARRKLGEYEQSDRDRAKVIANQLHLSSTALDDLTDARFRQLFPAQSLLPEGRERLTAPMGQVWFAIAADQLSAIQSGTTLETLAFLPGTTDLIVNGSLESGTGRAYIAKLNQGQHLTLNLEADNRTLLSIYTPTGRSGPLLADSTERFWSDILQESGYYEFVIANTHTSTNDYQLNFTVE